MPVPNFQMMLLPTLKELQDGAERDSGHMRSRMAAHFQLSEAEQGELLPSGKQSRFANRVAWALAYLRRAQLIESPRRGGYRITERGRGVLGEGLEKIDLKYLMRFPEVVAFRTQRTDGPSVRVDLHEADERDLTPDEQVREGYKQLRENLAAELLDRIKRASPKFFESLVVELLVAMGYGGSQEDAARVVGSSGDGGIDGIIKQDRLGLDNIYVQAKRWKEESTVGRPDIQQFAGALQGRKASKGVFMTTCSFSREAVEYARGVQTSIVLIDGEQLAELMLDYGIGVSVQESIRLQKIDEDYFVEE
jgi:restriction system protein